MASDTLMVPSAPFSNSSNKTAVSSTGRPRVWLDCLACTEMMLPHKWRIKSMSWMRLMSSGPAAEVLRHGTLKYSSGFRNQHIAFTETMSPSLPCAICSCAAWIKGLYRRWCPTRTGMSRNTSGLARHAGQWVWQARHHPVHRLVAWLRLMCSGSLDVLWPMHQRLDLDRRCWPVALVRHPECARQQTDRACNSCDRNAGSNDLAKG